MRKPVLTFVLFCFIFESAVFAFIKPQRNRIKSIHHHHTGDIKQKVVRPETYSASTKMLLNRTNKLASVERDKETNEVRILSGDFGNVQESQTNLSHYEEHALNFVAHNFDIFKVTPKGLKLIPKATYLGNDIQLIQFAVFKEGLLIEDASLSFRFKKKKLVQVTNYSFSEAFLKKEETFSLKDIETSLLNKTGAHSLTKRADSLRIEETDKGYALKQVASYELTDRDNIKLSIQIDKASNTIYEQKEDRFYLHGGIHGSAKAKIYPRWYNEDLEDLGVPHLNIKKDPSVEPALQSDVNGLFEVSDLVTGLHVNKLSGKYTKISNQTGPSISAEGIKESDFWSLHLTQPQPTNPARDKITAQYMVYYHVTKILGHAIKYIQPEWFNEPLVANTNLASNCNAHWDGRTINLYSGSARCANTGLISDVIYHEWGHGLDANTGGIQDSAFSEGIGDIISLLITRSNLLGIGFMLADGSPVRDLEPDKIYPRDKGEVHDEGLIIGSTFWDLYKALSKKYNPDTAIDLLSQYILKGIYTARTYVDMYQAILIIDDNDDNLENASPNTCLINKVFSDHGLAQSLTWCTLAAVENLDLQDENNNGTLEPGETVELFAKVHNPSPNALDGLTGTLSHNDHAVIVTQPTLQWDSIAPESSGVNTLPGSFVIRNDLACGSEIELNLKLTADTREVFSKKVFTIGKNTGTSEITSASDLPKEVLDYNVTISSLEVNSPQWESQPKIHKANLKFSINHTYIGDIGVHLVAPNGEKFPIYRGQGGADNISFDEDISGKIGHLDLAAGTWSLEVKDHSFRDQGSLESFSLTLSPKLFRCEEITSL